MKKLASFLILTMSGPAIAGLGGAPITGVESGASAGLVRKAAPAGNYRVQEATLADGTQLREYVTTEGKVFAVVWRGPLMPDLEQLFGPYFPTYRDAARAHGPDRSRLRVARPDLVVESGGHQRAFRGRAYLPQLLPAGVTANDLR